MQWTLWYCPSHFNEDFRSRHIFSGLSIQNDMPDEQNIAISGISLFHSCYSFVIKHTWWLIPRIVSGLVHPVISGLTLQQSHVNHWGYNPLTSRGMSHQVAINIVDCCRGFILSRCVADHENSAIWEWAAKKQIHSPRRDGSKPCTPSVHIKIAGIYGCSSP